MHLQHAASPIVPANELGTKRVTALAWYGSIPIGQMGISLYSNCFASFVVIAGEVETNRERQRRRTLGYVWSI